MTDGRVVHAVLAQTKMELRLLMRSGESLLVTLGVPLGILVFFGLVDVLPTGQQDPVDFLVPGVLAVSVLSTAMLHLAIQTAFERKYGVLKRLGGTPLTRGMFLVAKMLTVVIVLAVQTVLVLAVAATLLSWRPSGAALAVVAVMVAGAVTFTAVGMLIAGALRAEATLAVANALYVALLLVSGMVVTRDVLPETLATVGTWLPSGALTAGLRSAMQPAGTLDVAGLAALLGWGVAAGVLASRTFRWEA